MITWAHNETSTGVMVPVARPAGLDDGALVLIDATSGAGGLPVRDHRRRRLLLRSAEGVCLRRRAVAGADAARRRSSAIAKIDAERPTVGATRWIPEFLSLTTALENSVKDQTYNTPAVATLFLLADQIEWMLEHGGLEGMVRRTTASAAHLYGWAEAHPRATPFVADPAKRSLVVGTVDFDEGIDAAAIAATLRANGIVDVEPYRKLGRNQLRVAMFPATEPSDVQALTACIDWILEQS